MPEPLQGPQFRAGSMEDEIIRGMIHPFHQLRTFGYNGLTLPPGQKSGEKSRYFNVSRAGEPVR
ncbi:hypothetical protein D9M69_632510 [compost metagenome]